jgi:ABC-type uncharacterized transport system ATPase subunit
MTPAAALDRPHDSVVSLNGIWKSFGGLSVLKDVSIELRRGEVHVLLGENGAGKSTLVNVMIGAHAPDRGEVRLHAKPVDDLNPFVARQLGINAVMQDFSLAPAMTVAENYFLGREETRGPFLRKGEMRAAAHAAIQSLGVAIDVDTPVSDLSRPEQQLLEIIRALGGRPGALILDEPTATLSHDESEILFSTLDRLRRGGWAVLYITHRLNEVRLFRIRWSNIEHRNHRSHEVRQTAGLKKAPRRPFTRAVALDGHVLIRTAVECKRFAATILRQIDNPVLQRVPWPAETSRLSVQFETTGLQRVQPEYNGADFTLAAAD